MDIKKGILASVFALAQILLNHSAIASGKDDDNIIDAQFSQAELAQILAPIALYPDSLLTHIVIASTYPLEVVEAFRWRERNDNLSTAELMLLAEDKAWDPSVIALVAFPSVLERLSEDLSWTQNLGEAFLEDETLVLDTIQDLRQQAEQADSLANMQNMRVTKVKKQIIIEPIQPEIVFVPYYDTRIVYGKWQWYRYPPVYWDHRPYFSVHFPGSISGRFHFNSGINISFNYYFSAFRWSSRHLMVSDYRQSRHYRSHNRVATSYGAKRWQHKPSHRRNLAYRSHKLATRYQGRSHDKFSKQDKRTVFSKKLKNNDNRLFIGANNQRKSRQFNQRKEIARRQQYPSLSGADYYQQRNKAQEKNFKNPSSATRQSQLKRKQDVKPRRQPGQRKKLRSLHSPQNERGKK